jgi:hypothetical protein
MSEGGYIEAAPPNDWRRRFVQKAMEKTLRLLACGRDGPLSV